MEQLTIDDFKPHLNTKLKIYLDDTTALDSELIEVKGLGRDEDEPEEKEPFSVLYLGPESPVLPQRIYKIEHEKIGTLDLFIVPIGPKRGEKRIRYEAIFA